MNSHHSLNSLGSYQSSPYYSPDSPVQLPVQPTIQSYEDQIATHILTEFPEITEVLGQILDNESSQ